MSVDTQKFTFENPYNGGAGILVPSILKWRAKVVLKRLKKSTLESSQVDFEKAEGLLNSFLTRETRNNETGQRPAFAYCPKLTAKPFWEKEDAALLGKISALLSENFLEIKDEYNQGLRSNLTPLEIDSGKDFLEKNSWKNINLGGLGEFNEQAIKNYPKTVSVLNEFKESIFSSEFIVMEPDTVLPPHTDATNAYLVCHMGLDVGDNCGLRVHRETRDFHEKDIIFFDQSFVHSAWNKGSKTRVNLLITFFHPEINQQEQQLIQVFVEKIKRQCIIFLPLLLVEYAFLKLFSKFKTA